MTIQSIPFGAFLPPTMESNAQVTALSTAVQNVMTFDGTGDRLALITQIPRTGTLTGINFRTAVISTAGATFQLQLETVDASGNPSGTPYAANANGPVAVGTADDNTWMTVSINSGTGVSVTRGDFVAIVFTVSSGTPNTVQIGGTNANAMASVYGDFPYLVQDTGAGTWARLTSSGAILCCVFSYGGTIEYVHGATAVHTHAITSVGNDGERGLRFNLPFPLQIGGARLRLCNIAAGGNFRVRLYEGTTTIRADSGEIDGDIVLGATQDNYYDIRFPTPYVTAANTTYYLTVWQLTANNVSLHEVNVVSADYMNAVPGGSDLYLASRAAGGTGAWTETDTTRPNISLFVNGIDDGAGGAGGGMIVHPGMTGRLAA